MSRERKLKLTEQQRAELVAGIVKRDQQEAYLEWAKGQPTIEPAVPVMPMIEVFQDIIPGPTPYEVAYDEYERRKAMDKFNGVKPKRGPDPRKPWVMKGTYEVESIPKPAAKLPKRIVGKSAIALALEQTVIEKAIANGWKAIRRAAKPLSKGEKRENVGVIVQAMLTPMKRRV